MALTEKQFELDGVVFGLGAGVELKDGGWNPGGPGLRVNDVDVPARSGRRFGRGFKSSTTWAFSLFANGTSESDGWAKVKALQAAWESPFDDADVIESDTIMPLRYRIAGSERVVYGQPRRFTPTVDNLSMAGRIDIEADFELVYPLYLDPVENMQRIPILAPLDTESGFVVPFFPPFQSSLGAGQTQAQITVGGERTTPLWITFDAGTGPLDDAYVSIDGKIVSLSDPVSPTDNVIADARPWKRSIATATGGVVAVSPRVTRISELWVGPGTHQVIFNGVDPTSTAAIEVRWQNAYRTPR